MNICSLPVGGELQSEKIGKTMNPRINRYIKRRLRNRTVITVICTAVVISLAAGVLYYTKLRKNLFSKNIYPENNSPLARTTDSSESLIY